MTFFCPQVSKAGEERSPGGRQLAPPSAQCPLRPFQEELPEFCCSGIFLKTSLFLEGLKNETSCSESGPGEAGARWGSLGTLTATELGEGSQVLGGWGWVSGRERARRRRWGR